MKNLELSIDREIEFMLKYDLSADELFVIRVIFYAQDEHAEYLSKYFTNSKAIDLRSTLLSLQAKGIINKSYIVPDTGEQFNPRDVDFNQNVVNQYLRHSQELGLELFMAYPAFTTINGKTFSLRNITKLYKNLDEMCFAYGKSINFAPLKHQEVMELLEWAKDTNNIRSGICDFIESRQWMTLKEMKDGGTTMFDTLEAL